MPQILEAQGIAELMWKDVLLSTVVHFPSSSALPHSGSMSDWLELCLGHPLAAIRAEKSSGRQHWWRGLEITGYPTVSAASCFHPISCTSLLCHLTFQFQWTVASMRLNVSLVHSTHGLCSGNLGQLYILKHKVSPLLDLWTFFSLHPSTAGPSCILSKHRWYLLRLQVLAEMSPPQGDLPGPLQPEISPFCTPHPCLKWPMFLFLAYYLFSQETSEELSLLP